MLERRPSSFVLLAVNTGGQGGQYNFVGICLLILLGRWVTCNWWLPLISQLPTRQAFTATRTILFTFNLLYGTHHSLIICIFYRERLISYYLRRAIVSCVIFPLIRLGKFERNTRSSLINGNKYIYDFWLYLTKWRIFLGRRYLFDYDDNYMRLWLTIIK